MGFFDRFFGRKQEEQKPKASVPVDDFFKFREEVRKSFSELHGQFTQVVKENEALKRQLHQFGDRLDEIQRHQMLMGQETRHEINKIVSIAQRVSSSHEKGLLNPQEKAAFSSAVLDAQSTLNAPKSQTSAAIAAASLVGKLGAPAAESGRQQKPT